jgi:hypothetical protein
MTKPLHVFIRQQGGHFRVVYQRHYPNGSVEEMMLMQRFKTRAEAQSHADDGLRAQRIYRALATGDGTKTRRFDLSQNVIAGRA